MLCFESVQTGGQIDRCQSEDTEIKTIWKQGAEDQASRAVITKIVSRQVLIADRR